MQNGHSAKDENANIYSKMLRCAVEKCQYPNIVQQKLKTKTLTELATFVIANGEHIAFSDELRGEFMSVLSANLFGQRIGRKDVPHSSIDSKQRELIHSLLLTFVQSCYVSTATLSKFVNRQFCQMFISLFQSSVLRPYDRKYLSHILQQVQSIVCIT